MARLLIVEDNQALAALLVSAARDRGYEAFAAHTGASAMRALRQGHPDAAVVDLLLPDLPGTDLLDLLTSLRVPALAVSGVYKGSPFAEDAVGKHGALAFFEKPFDLAQLLDAVDRACGREPADLPEIQVLEEPQVPYGELVELPPVEAAGVEQPPTPAELEDPLTAPLPFAERGTVWERPTTPSPWARPRTVRSLKESGSLADEQVPGILTALHLARFTGDVRLRQGSILKVLAFGQGRAVAAASNLAHERFAPFCIRRGVLPAERLGEVTALAQQEELRTSDAMVRLGLLTPEQRTALLVEQTKEVFWSTFGWREGHYEVAPRRMPRTGAAPESLFLGDLILEGVMRTEALEALREKVPRTCHLTPTADPPYALHDLHFTDAQARLVAYSDGSKSVEDLLALIDLPERDVLATLHALELLGLVEPRREPSPSRRISFGL